MVWACEKGRGGVLGEVRVGGGEKMGEMGKDYREWVGWRI